MRISGKNRDLQIPGSGVLIEVVQKDAGHVRQGEVLKTLAEAVETEDD